MSRHGYVITVLVAVLSPIFAQPKSQWTQGVPVSPAPNIRIAIGGTAIDTKLNRDATRPTTKPPNDGIPPERRQNRQRTPMTDPSNQFLSPFAHMFFDHDFMNDIPCGLSRPRGNSPQAMDFWRFGFFHSAQFTCSCHAFGDTFDFADVDRSPQASIDCNTAFTGVLCCST